MAGPNSKFIDSRARVRKLNGNVVKPCLYNGNAVGHGKYYAAMVNDVLVLDANKKPFQFRDCGELVLVHEGAK